MTDNRVIILAAGQGTRLRPYTNEIPKCMVPLHGRPLLNWQLAALHSVAINDIVVVGGYQSEKLTEPGICVIRNPEFESTNMVQSLWCARDYFNDGFIMCYGDIVYNPDVIKRLLHSPGDICVVVDKKWRSYWERRTNDVLNDAESLSLDTHGKIRSIGQKVNDINLIEGQYIGMVAFRRSGVQKIRQVIQREQSANSRGEFLLCPPKSLRQLFMTDLLQGLINEGVSIDPVWVDGGWLEIDTVSDLALAESLTAVKNNYLCIER